MAAKNIECEGATAVGAVCGNTLGQWAAGYVLMTYRKREILCSPLSIVCEECGWTWRPPDDIARRAVGPVGDAGDTLRRVS